VVAPTEDVKVDIDALHSPIAWEIDGIAHIYFQCTIEDWQTDPDRR
jgi:hypothetical protein